VRRNESQQAVVDLESQRGNLDSDLSWTHHRLLTKAESPQARDSFEIEAVRVRLRLYS
jgi:hypothetical protein